METKTAPQQQPVAALGVVLRLQMLFGRQRRQIAAVAATGSKSLGHCRLPHSNWDGGGQKCQACQALIPCYL